MNIVSRPRSDSTYPLATGAGKATSLLLAGRQIACLLERGKAVSSADLRSIMIEAFGDTDAAGCWLWKDAYDACEAAQVLFLQKFGRLIIGRSDRPGVTLAMLAKVAALLPTHTRRSDESQELQQLSTPLPLAFVAAHAASISASDIVLEPSAGTGLLAIFAAVGKAQLALYEVAADRNALLGGLFASGSLRRPLDELRFEVQQLEETNWEETDEATFATAWSAEIDNLPEFSVSTLHIVSGLLLPIGRLLPQDYCRVYRLETDEGQRIVGRVIAPSAIATLCRNLGVDRGSAVSAEQALSAVADGSSVALLAGDLSLRRVRVMNDYRVELTGFSEGMRDWLKAAGLFCEIINWKTRYFIPFTDDGPAFLARLTDRHRLFEFASRR